MRISVEDGIVVCSLEDKKSGFLAAAHDYFKGFYHNKLKIHVNVSEDADETERAAKEFWTIVSLEVLAGNYTVNVDRTVRERKERLRSFMETVMSAEKEARAKEAEKQYNREKWERLCKHGCGSCKQLRMDGDDFRCGASGDLLDFEQRPKVIGGVHYLFNYEALPSDNCPFKVN